MRNLWTDDEWYDFLDDLSSNPGRYVPVVGPELMVYREDGKRVSVFRRLGERLADKLRIRHRDLPDGFEVVEVVRAYQLRREDFSSAKPYTSIVELLNEEEWPVPDPVQKLASIRHFDLLLNTTWLPFLKLALEREREFPVVQRSNIVGKPIEDFDDGDIGAAICLYNLFGSTTEWLPARPITFSVTDDDQLECMHRLLSNPPKNASSHLLARDRELLVWGCSFSNWLARFFFYSLIRTVPLQAGEGRRMRVVADSLCGHDDSLRAFWTSLNAPIYEGDSVLEFVDELHARWHKEFAHVPDPLAVNSQHVLQDSNPFSTGEIFISYAREDAATAKQFATRLREAGLPVWMDLDCLQHGDLFRAKIRSNIQYCSCFIPLLSPNAIGKIEEGGFMYEEEWLFAQEQADLRRDGGIGQTAFIFPAIIHSDVDPCDPRLPTFIRGRHVASVIDEVPQSLLNDLRQSCKNFRRARGS